MTKQPHLPETSDGSHSPDGRPAYSVGYGKPPKHTQYPPGTSGNRRGRPKGKHNVRTVVEEALNKRIKIRVGNRTRSLTKLEVLALTLITNALKGDAKATASLIALCRSTGMTGEAPAAGYLEPFTSSDEALIADCFVRHEADLKCAEARKSGEKPSANGAMPPIRRTTS